MQKLMFFLILCSFYGSFLFSRSYCARRDPSKVQVPLNISYGYHANNSKSVHPNPNPFFSWFSFSHILVPWVGDSQDSVIQKAQSNSWLFSPSLSNLSLRLFESSLKYVSHMHFFFLKTTYFVLLHSLLIHLISRGFPLQSISKRHLTYEYKF